MKPFLYSFSFCFIRYEVGMLNPFYIVLVFVLNVTRWVCATLLIYFLLLFYMLRCGYVKPFIYFLVFGFICYQVGM